MTIQGGVGTSRAIPWSIGIPHTTLFPKPVKDLQMSMDRRSRGYFFLFQVTPTSMLRNAQIWRRSHVLVVHGHSRSRNPLQYIQTSRLSGTSTHVGCSHHVGTDAHRIKIERSFVVGDFVVCASPPSTIS
jgi:hypothetical protein